MEKNTRNNVDDYFQPYEGGSDKCSEDADNTIPLFDPELGEGIQCSKGYDKKSNAEREKLKGDLLYNLSLFFAFCIMCYMAFLLDNPYRIAHDQLAHK